MAKHKKKRGGKMAKHKRSYKRKGCKIRHKNVMVGAGVFRVKRITNCVPAGLHQVRCTVETSKEPVRRLKIMQHALPGISGLGRRRKRK